MERPRPASEPDREPDRPVNGAALTACGGPVPGRAPSAARLLWLQQTAGNRAVGRVLARMSPRGERIGLRLPAPAPADLRLASPEALRLQRAAGNAALGRRPVTLTGPRAVARAVPGLVAPPSGPVGVPGLPPPGTAPPPLPRIPGGLGGLRWVGTAAATAESIMAGSGAAAAGATTVVEGTVAVGGVALGEGALVAAETALVAGGAAATGEAAAIAVAGTAIAEGATVVVAGTATATAATTGAGAAGAVGGAALITPVGWVVIGVIVVGVAVGATVYLVMRYHEPETNARAPLAGSGRPGKGSMAPPPRIAPGAGRSAPIVEPDRATPALTPGQPGSTIAEPEAPSALEAPGLGTCEPLELGSDLRPPPVDQLHGRGLAGIPPAAPHRSVEELRRGLREALRATTYGPSDGRSLIDDVRAVIRAGRVPRTPANDTLLAMLEDAYRINRDPSLVEEAAVELWIDAGQLDVTVREALELFFENRVQDVDDELTLQVLAADPPFRDIALAADIHGAHTHMFSEHLLELELGTGAGRRFRQAIANATGPAVPETARGGRLKPFPWAVWDAIFDVAERDQINCPETLGQILQQHLGLPRWMPQ